MKLANKQCCDFCNEISDESDNEFNRIYNGHLNSRIVWASEFLIVLPTIGQFIDNSLLILPRNHHESLSDLSMEELNDLASSYNIIYDKLSKFGQVIAFEHGAHSATGGGCGIYHAHLHILPVQAEVNLFSFFKHEHKEFDSINEAILSLGEAQEYLLAINSNKKVGVLDLSNLKGSYPSQFFRQMLCEFLNISLPWDWRRYKEPEDRLIKIVTQTLLVD